MSVDMAVKVLDESINQVVLIKLKGSKTIRGNRLGFDLTHESATRLFRINSS